MPQLLTFQYISNPNRVANAPPRSPKTPRYTVFPVEDGAMNRRYTIPKDSTANAKNRSASIQTDLCKPSCLLPSNAFLLNSTIFR